MMTHQTFTNKSFHSLAFGCGQHLAPSFPLLATLAFTFFLGSGNATAASTISVNPPSTVTTTALKTAKVKKPVTVKPVTIKPVTVKPESQGNHGGVAAATFGQKEVDQNKFIAIAAPYDGGNRYQLLVLEQISPKKACWNESETSSGTVVKPLLLNFDFTGICGRSTDSNGYSIRMGGQDLGVQYDLNIVRQGEQLVLVGTNFRDRNAPTMEIGRTSGISNGLIKINLEPGWRFSKRTYEGKLLGHVYLSSDNLAVLNSK